MRYLSAVTVEQLKSEAAKLPPNDRFALAEWIEQFDDVRALQNEELIHAIQHGIEQADRGELIDADEVFTRLRESQRASDWRKRVIGHQIRTKTSVSLRWISDRLKMGSITRVSRLCSQIGDVIAKSEP